jgi:hypothetical protein
LIVLLELARCQTPVFRLPHVIGEGFRKGGVEYFDTPRATVYLRNGKLWTAFPSE